MDVSKITWLRRSWTELHDIGSSKVVNSAFIWLVLIPFLAKVLFAIHAEFGPDLKMPFNFLAFYYAAFFFTIAAALYQWKCPNIVKLAPTFGAFQEGGYSPLELKKWFHELAESPHGPQDRDGELVIQFLQNAGAPANLSPAGYVDLMSKSASANLMGTFWQYSIPPDKLPAVHDLTISLANRKSGVARSFATACYALGLVLFALVVLLNLRAVVKETHWPF